MIPPSIYINSASLLGNVTGGIIDSRHLDQISFTASWTAFAATAGDWRIEVTDDPRAAVDLQEGTSTATWVERTIPSGAYDGTNITVSGKNITIGASAGTFNLDLVDLPSFIRLKYVRSAGGTTAQASVWVSAKS